MSVIWSVTYCFTAPAKSFKTSLGFVKISIIKLPKDASLSIKTFVIVPITFIAFANLFCPSSELVKAEVTAPIAIISKPIPVAAIAPFKVLKPNITFFKPPAKFLNPLTAPPVILSRLPVN